MVAQKLSERGGTDEAVLVLNQLLTHVHSLALTEPPTTDESRASSKSVDNSTIEIDRILEKFSPEAQLVLRVLIAKSKTALRGIIAPNSDSNNLALKRRREELPRPDKDASAEVNRKKKQISFRINPLLIPIVNLAAECDDLDRNNWIMRACAREAHRNGHIIPPELNYLIED